MEPKLLSREQQADKLLRVLVFTLILSVMNASMFNVALPVIRAEFDLTPSQVGWMLTGYMIVYAIGSVTFGKLADKYRLKDLLTYGLIAFALGSVVGLAATEFWMVIAGRLFQAAGASVIPATAMIVPVRYFSPEKRGRALGTTAVGLALGAALGPIVSGVVSGLVSWRYLFALSILAIFVLPFFRKYLDNETGTARSIDYFGGLMLAGTVASLLLAITKSSLLLGGLGVLLLLLFLLRIRTAAEPFVQPAIFRNKSYTLGLCIAFVLTGLNFGLPFMAPQFLAALNHLSPLAVGFVLFPSAICAALLGKRGGKLADEKGNRYLFAIASGLIMLSFAALSSVVGMSAVWISCFMIFGTVGQSFIQIAMSNTISRTLTKEQVGVGMGIFAMLNFIAGATSTTLIGKALDAESAGFRLNPFAPGAGLLYSNILVLLLALVIVVTFVYFSQFRSPSASSVPARQASVSGK
ncbi:MFS transporter [Paenibacillus ginsengarvi]|uniref:MFS transporter n=1 Tax=Paenibacillus ginsengarvi TaxID=400777 RepID=A0A3B0C093_9BACL|nr:MFS transporter [Paenibacillus ginsengarvi]RKN78952.1 MFS transporter [Paenibacillus ginsengarvi]